MEQSGAATRARLRLARCPRGRSEGPPTTRFRRRSVDRPKELCRLLGGAEPAEAHLRDEWRDALEGDAPPKILGNFAGAALCLRHLLTHLARPGLALQCDHDCGGEARRQVEQNRVGAIQDRLERLGRTWVGRDAAKRFNEQRQFEQMVDTPVDGLEAERIL